MGKIKRGIVPSSFTNIPKPNIQASDTVRFSFKNLDFYSNDKFGVHRCGAGYLAKLLERLRDVSGFKEVEFRANRSSSLKSHEIDWATTSEPEGFTSLNPQLRALKAWQFEVTRNEHGRIHGFLLGDTFFVVWIDPDHQLYPGR